MSLLSIQKDGLYIDGKPFSLISGDIHYFRSFKASLERRLEYAKAFGLTTIQTYVPWNLHEPESNQFCFEGLADLASFLEMAKELNLKVLLRPAPYICSEWDMGGLPYWLLKEDIALRCADEKFLSYVKRYYEKLVPVFLPYLSTNGGPIIAVTIENEYGSYGNDTEYLKAIQNMLTDLGVNVPFYTTDGYDANMLTYGTVKDVWAGANYRVESSVALKALSDFQPDKPKLIGEYWSGRAIYWDEEFSRRNIEDVANGFKEALENGGLMNFYMFSGGSNFGFMNGANFGKTFGALPETPVRYIAHTTSYDEDALLDERGVPTEKYFACRKVLFDFLGKEAPKMPEFDTELQQIEDINFKEGASLWDWADYSKAFSSIVPLAMEKMNQDFGFVLYKTEFIGCGLKMKLKIDALRDRALIFADRKYVGTLFRERDDEVYIQTEVGKKITIEIVVENMGRINYGPKLCEKKGIDGGVFLDHVQLFHWQCLPLRLKNFDDVPFKEETRFNDCCFLKGEFKAQEGRDIILDMSKMTKGVCFVNGFNLGRYWNRGPQLSLYLPGEIVKENNVIEVFELYGADDTSIIKSGEKILFER